MTALGDAIDNIDPDEREACVEAVAHAIEPYSAPAVALACLYFALIAVGRLPGDLDELMDDLPRLGRSVLNSQMDKVTRQ